MRSNNNNNNNSRNPQAVMQLDGYIQLIVSEFNMRRVEQIGLAVQAFEGWMFEESGDGAEELVYTTTAPVLDIPIPPRPRTAGVGTGAGAEAAANPDANSGWGWGWETTLTALRERLAAVVWEGNGGYCDVQINIYQRTYEILSEGSVTLNLYRLSAVLDFSETELGLAAPDSTSFDFDGVSDIVRNVLLELASPPLGTGSLHRQSHDHQPTGSGEASASAGSESAVDGEGEGEALPFRIYPNGDGLDAEEVEGAGDEEDDNIVEDAEARWLSIARLAGNARHIASTGSADYALEVNVQLHLPTHNRPGDTVHCLAFDHAFYAQLVERFGADVFLSTTWTNPSGYTVIDGEYPEDFDHEDEDEI